MESKKNIVYTLVAFTVFLILLNVVLDLFGTENIEVNNDENISRIEIEKSFTSVLKKFGIKDSWVKKKKINDNTLDSINYKYGIVIPTDVPIPMILKELNQNFNNRNVKIISIEKKNFGSTSLRVKSGKYVKLIAELNYKKEIYREHSTIAFIIKDVESLNEVEFDNLLSTPIKFAVLLPLQTESVPIAEKILKSKRTYYIFLDDDSDNIKFELDEDLNVNTLKRNIKSIVSSFNTPLHFFISKKGTGFPNNFMNYIKEEFNRKGRKVLNLKSFVNLKGENKKDLNSLLEFYLNKIEPGSSKIFFIDIDDWEDILETTNAYLKKGNKIKLPSQLL